MSRLDGVLKARRARGWPLAGWIVMALVATFAVWAYLTQLEEVAVAPGEVVPHGQVKVIQHLEGGIIERLDVAEGDSVTAGQPLVQLALGVQIVNREEQQVKRDALVLNRARLAAEAKGAALEFPDEVAARRPAFARAETETFKARRRELASRLDSLRGQVRQKELKVGEFKAKRAALEADLGRVREILDISKGLLAEGLTSKLEHLGNLRQVERIEGELEALKSSIPRTRAALEEARERLREERLKFRREALEELSKVELAIASTDEVLAIAADQAGRTVIRSPIDGVVQNLRFHTIGGVVRAGDPIMEIVPSRGNLVVEAHLNPIDRGYVQVGQRAAVKVSTYDFIRYGGLDGEVIQVSPDTVVDQGGMPYFRVVVRTDKAYLGATEGEYPITTGMQATVDIHTGSRSVMDYLLRPVLKLRHEAFRER